MSSMTTHFGYRHKRLIIVADGGYCNKAILTNLTEGVDLVARCRKDAKLCKRSQKKGKFYEDEKFTPQSYCISLSEKTP